MPSQIHNISIPASAPTVVMRCASGESPSRSLSQTFQRIDAFCDEVVCGREHGDLIRVSQSLKPSKKKSNTSEIHLKLKADFISLIWVTEMIILQEGKKSHLVIRLILPVRFSLLLFHKWATATSSLWRPRLLHPEPFKKKTHFDNHLSGEKLGH